MKARLIAFVSVVASIITIVVFTTGKQSLLDLITGTKSYEEGLPPAPPDIRSDIPVPAIISRDDAALSPNSGCFFERGKLAIVIKANQESAIANSLSSYELSDENGVRSKYYMDEQSNADAGWLDVIMVPGRRLRINYTVCGNAGISTLTRVEAIPRH